MRGTIGKGFFSVAIAFLFLSNAEADELVNLKCEIAHQQIQTFFSVLAISDPRMNELYQSSSLAAAQERKEIATAVLPILSSSLQAIAIVQENHCTDFKGREADWGPFAEEAMKVTEIYALEAKQP